jgi:hypothetical protein
VRLRQFEALIRNTEHPQYKLVRLLPHFRRGLDLAAE